MKADHMKIYVNKKHLTIRTLPPDVGDYQLFNITSNNCWITVDRGHNHDALIIQEWDERPNGKFNHMVQMKEGRILV